MLLSAYLITFNEAQYLDQVLRQLQGVDELIVVDSGSTDGTQDIARRHGAKVIHQDWLGFARQRAFACEQCQGQWILSVDGDEILEDGAIEEIRHLIQNTSMNGFGIPRAEVFMGAPMLRARLDPQMRVFRKDKIAWELTRLVHEHMDIEQPTGVTTKKMLHYGNSTIAKNATKINSYSSLKAQQKFNAGKQGSIAKMLLSPVGYFIQHMLTRGYWREGLRGVVFSGLQAYYSFLSEAKLIELRYVADR